MKTVREKICKAGNTLTHNILGAVSAGHKAKSMFGKVVYSHPECHGHFGALAIPAVDWFTQYAEDSKKGKKKNKEAISTIFF